MGEVLSATQLKRLSEHKYSAEGVSVVEPQMQIFWRWLVEQVPLWWAPNAITLGGLLLNVFTSLILMFYSPDAKQEPPGWAFLSVAFGLFVYQALDAIDGKQARRLKAASPLGELFDHGCDAVSTVFVCIGTCIAIQLGHNKTLLFLEAFCTMFMFYAAHWQAYCSGTLKFGKVDVTEAQFAVMSVYIITGILGPSFWTNTIPLIGVPLKYIPVMLSVVAAVLAFQTYFGVIFWRGGVGKNGSTVAGTSVLSPVFPFGILILLAFMIWQKSPSHIFEEHPVLYILSFGMSAAKITNKLVIAHMSKSEMDILDSSMIGPGMLFLNQYLDCIINEYIILWLCFLFCLGDLLCFSVQVCRQICDYLNIYCFKITACPPTKGGASNSTTNGSHSNSAATHTGPVTRSSVKGNRK